MNNQKKKVKNLSKGSKPLSQGKKPHTEPEADPKSINQKKNLPQKKGSYKNEKDIYLNNYMKTFIKEKGSTGRFYCSICPAKPEFQKRSVYRHILEASSHKECKKDEEEHKTLVLLIQEKIGKNKEKKSKMQETNHQDKKDYLNFLIFCQKLNLSFNQISQLGKYLSDEAQKNQLKFLSKYSFERGEISLFARCFGKFLVDELKKDLENSPFSLCIDNSTVAKKSICALKVRYLKEFADDKGMIRNYLQNKIIGIKYLEESSSAKTTFQIAKEKLLDLSEEIKKNFVGFVHDHHSTLTGDKGGLGVLLKTELSTNFMDLKDPCHSLNLSLIKSLEILPDEMTKFVDKIHSHFGTTQRVAYLLNLQKENKLRQLNLKPYAKTRWLSLGQSLDRLLIIWGSLVLYMKKNQSFRA